MIHGRLKVLRDDRRTEQRIRDELKKLERTYAVAGYPGDVGQHLGSGLTMAELAAVHEFGSVARNIPSRPFMRSTADDPSIQKRGYNLASRILDKVYAGTLKASQGVNQLGAWYVGEIQKRITRGPWVPNTLRTEKAKGSSRPLIDTTQLRNSTTYRVRFF